MRTDPKPEQPLLSWRCQGAVIAADAGRPELVDSFEMQGWVPRVSLEEFEVLVGQIADFFWQPLIECPKLWRGEMVEHDHSKRLAPAGVEFTIGFVNEAVESP